MSNYASKIKLCGDWAPSGRNVFTSISGSFVLNIEGPVFLNHLQIGLEKQNKAGPSVFNQSLPDVFCPSVAVLANNHLMDFGHVGLASTINALEREKENQKWRFVGAGDNLIHARKPLLFEHGGARIGILSRCEIQFGIATRTKPGVAAFDSSIYKQIRDLKKQVDFVIVSIHAAAEMVPWPSPRRQETWRSLVDAGADVIHGHHAHIPQGWEEYNGGFIFYGLGNFCVDPQKWLWHPQGLWSLSPELEPTVSGLRVTTATTVIDELGDSIRVREACHNEKNKHMAYLEQCNRPLSAPILLEGLWQEASVRMYNDYFAKWLGFDSPSMIKFGGRLLRAKLGTIKRRLFEASSKSTRPPNTDQLLLWYHLFECDSHNDAIGTALGLLSGEVEDCRNEETSRLAREWMVLN